MLLSGTEFTSKSTNCHHSDFYQAKHNMTAVHYLTWNPIYVTNCVSAMQMFRDFIAFCRKCCVRKAFINRGDDETSRLRAWLMWLTPPLN